MLSGEEEAASLGVDVPAVRVWTVVWTSVLTGAAVSIGGNVGFVGLIVPHALRPFVGVEHRKLVPAAALAGGAFVVVCDVVSRALPTRSEVPLGVVTGLLGAPVFLSLLLRVARGEEHV
jgi:iron complex transport system permease protein